MRGTTQMYHILNRGHPGYYLSEYLTDNSGSKVGRTSELETKPTRELCCLVQLSASDQLKDSAKAISFISKTQHGCKIR